MAVWKSLFDVLSTEFQKACPIVHGLALHESRDKYYGHHNINFTWSFSFAAILVVIKKCTELLSRGILNRQSPTPASHERQLKWSPCHCFHQPCYHTNLRKRLANHGNDPAGGAVAPELRESGTIIRPCRWRWKKKMQAVKSTFILGNFLKIRGFLSKESKKIQKKCKTIWPCRCCGSNSEGIHLIGVLINPHYHLQSYFHFHSRLHYLIRSIARGSDPALLSIRRCERRHCWSFCSCACLVPGQ